MLLIVSISNFIKVNKDLLFVDIKQGQIKYFHFIAN